MTDRRPPRPSEHAGLRFAARILLATAGVALVFAACGDARPPTAGETPELVCDLAPEFLVETGVGRGGIPSLTNPELISADPMPANAYLADEDRVIGIELDGSPVAVPHNILWYHEIVNFDGDDASIAVTYCPLTGSSLVFDRAAVDGQEFGVSGLVFMNNLVMYNRGEPAALWPQMAGRARCDEVGEARLDPIPAVEMSWRGWRDLYPETLVVSSDVNISRDYTLYPYGDYESLDRADFLYAAMPPVDPRRPAKERVLGLPSSPSGEPGIAFPFGALEATATSWAVVSTDWEGDEVVVLWSDQRGGGGVFRADHPDGGGRLTLRATSGGGIVDDETGTRWSANGVGVDGPLVGRRLDPVADAYVAFWGAWAAFHPATRLWTGP